MPRAVRWSEVLLGAFGFALMTAYWPGIAGAATTPRWIVASLLGLAWFMLPPMPRSASATVGIVLLAWLGLSLSWSGGTLDGVDTALKLSLALMAFAVGAQLPDLRPLFAGAAIGLAVSSVVALGQAYGWHGIASIDGTPAGLFVNRDRLGAAAALVIVGLMSLKIARASLVLWVLPGLLLANSRGAMLAMLAGLCFVPAPKFVRAFVIGFAVAAVAAALVIKGVDLSSSERLWIWRDTISGVTFWGHGLGSFRELYPTYLDAFAQSWAMTTAPTRPEHPHNEILWMLFEGGAPALLLAGLFCVSLWSASTHAVRSVLVCLFVLCQFAMPLHDPATLILGAVVAGFLAGRGALSARLSFACRDPLCEGVAAYERGIVGLADGDRGQALSV